MSSKKARSAYNPSPSDLDYLEVSGSGVITINGWETGYLGNADYIPILPSDLIVNTVQDTKPFNQTEQVEIGTISNEGGGKSFPFTGSTMHSPFNGYVGQKIIPKGFKITGAVMSGTIGATWRMTTGSLADATTGFLTTPVNNFINISATFNAPIVGDGLIYVTFNFDPTTSVQAFFGGKIFMEKV